MTVHPSRIELVAFIDPVISRELSREAASAWACELHLVQAADPIVEEALDVLSLIDARHVREDRPLNYMYDFDELRKVRRALESGGL